MEKVAGIVGVLFRARNPKALAEWYRDYLGVDVVLENYEMLSRPTPTAASLASMTPRVNPLSSGNWPDATPDRASRQKIPSR
jgi:hypothetical protein